MNRLAVAASLLLACGVARGQRLSLPDGVVPAGLGANIHFTDPMRGETQMMARAGITWVRMDFDWNQIETEKGNYDFGSYDRLMKALEEQKIRPIFILDYVHRLYDDAQSPHTPEARAAMARWAAASVRHFRGRGIVWEMYNEPNIFPFWRPKPNVDDYVKLAAEVGTAIRLACPGEIYVGAGTSGIDFGFLEACFRGGLLRCWSAVSVHPYRQLPPETVSADYRRLRALIARYAPPNKSIPIISSEWGYSAGWYGMTPERQGRMLARQWLTNLANAIPISIWYDWHDDGLDPKEPEHHFGTVHNPYRAAQDPVYEPKPAYLAARTLTQALAGLRFSKRLDLHDPDSYLYLFSAGKRVRLAAWTTSPANHTVTLPFPKAGFRVTGYTGETAPELAPGAALAISDSPTYLEPVGSDDLLTMAGAVSTAPLELVARGSVPTRLTMRVSNPLGRPVRARLNHGPWVPMMPGGRTTLSQTVRGEQTADPVAVAADVEIEGLGAIRQSTAVVSADPLVVDMLPASGRSLSVRVASPTGAGFRGRLEILAAHGIEPLHATADIRIARGATEQVLSFGLRTPASGTYSAGFRVLTERGEAALTVPTSHLRGLERPAPAPGGEGAMPCSVFAEGDDKVDSEQTLASTTPADGAPVRSALTLSYRFGKGWKYLAVKPQGDAARAIPGEPRALGLWVLGDGSGNNVRMRYTDSTGQTFQPDGPTVSWKGWRYVVMPMDGSGGHWGGENSGVVRYPIVWEALFLLDSTGGGPSSGAVSIACPTLHMPVR